MTSKGLNKHPNVILEKKVNAVVPQGSILGPLLFLTYINDIGNIVESNIRLFADETCLCFITDRDDQDIASL